MPAKTPYINQHSILHQYWPDDCCLCKKEEEIAELKAKLNVKENIKNEEPQPDSSIADEIIRQVNRLNNECLSSAKVCKSLQQELSTLRDKIKELESLLNASLQRNREATEELSNLRKRLQMAEKELESTRARRWAADILSRR